MSVPCFLNFERKEGLNGFTQFVPSIKTILSSFTIVGGFSNQKKKEMYFRYWHLKKSMLYYGSMLPKTAGAIRRNNMACRGDLQYNIMSVNSERWFQASLSRMKGLLNYNFFIYILWSGHITIMRVLRRLSCKRIKELE